MRWLILLAAACADSPSIYQCRQVATCEDWAPNVQEWPVCASDAETVARNQAEACGRHLLGYCIWWQCEVRCEDTGDACELAPALRP